MRKSHKHTFAALVQAYTGFFRGYWEEKNLWRFEFGSLRGEKFQANRISHGIEFQHFSVKDAVTWHFSLISLCISRNIPREFEGPLYLFWKHLHAKVIGLFTHHEKFEKQLHVHRKKQAITFHVKIQIIFTLRKTYLTISIYHTSE